VLTEHKTFGIDFDLVSSFIPKWHVVLVDEAHKAKDEQTNFSKYLPQLEADMYCLLSGTIVHNDIENEFARIMELVIPKPLSDLVDMKVSHFHV